MGDKIIQTLRKIGSPQKLGPPSLICRNLEIWEKYSWMVQNALKSNELRRNWVHQTFKIEIQKGEPNNLDFLQNHFPEDFRSSLLIF